MRGLANGFSPLTPREREKLAEAQECSMIRDDFPRGIPLLPLPKGSARESA